MRRRSALWAAVAAVGLVAAGLVVAARGGGDDPADIRADLPKLPAGAGGAGDEAARAAADSLTIAPAGRYVPGDGLPELGGEAPAYALEAEVTEASVRQLAEALGVEGEPTDDGAGYWVVDGAERALYVNGPDGSWSVSEKLVEAVEPVPSPTYVPSPELLCPDVAMQAPRDDVKPPEGCESPWPADAGAGGGVGDEPRVAPPPVDLPSQEEAVRIALDALAGTGADLEGADVTADDYSGAEWVVVVEPKVAGLPAPGLNMYVNVGDGGAVRSASGTLARTDELGDYPLLDTRAALERLNEQRVSIAPAIDLGGRDIATDDPAVAPEPLPEDPTATTPVEALPDIPVTGAEIVLSAQWSSDVDDPHIYLVPSYRFTAADGSFPEVTAVVDDLLSASTVNVDGG